MNINIVDSVDRNDMERMRLQREKQTGNEEKRRGRRVGKERERSERTAKGVLLYIPLAVRILVISSFACANYVTF